jgi:hypothetical protein
MAAFAFPGASDKIVIIGQNGSGKTIGGAWVLTKQDFTKRPWVAMDYKDEEFWDQVGSPPMRQLHLGDMPGKTGLYRMRCLPGQEEEVERWLWKVWEHGNIGLFCDEVTLLPRKHAFKAILRQGRSLRIPLIACTQRPVGVDRELFSEARFKMIFNLDDDRDMDVVAEFTKNVPLDVPLPRHWSYWYDGHARRTWVLRPVPNPNSLARELKATVPQRLGFLA